ncbi:MAG: hypothetical protein MR536_07215 [Prevotella sp.]|nr:hypothetical protein [Prevotella sp.]
MKNIIHLISLQSMPLMRGLKCFCLLIASLLLGACGETEFEYSGKRIYFVFENQKHLNANLAAAMTPYSNVFAVIQQADERVDGTMVSYIAVSSSKSAEISKTKLNAVDLRRPMVLGQRNGIIVGYGILSDPLTFYAYDLECPNCYDTSVGYSKDYYLTVNNLNKAHCPNCKRTYDLDNGGIVSSGDNGNKLIRYRAGTTGAYGVLTVN